MVLCWYHQYLDVDDNPVLSSWQIQILHCPLHQFLYLSVLPSCWLEALPRCCVWFALDEAVKTEICLIFIIFNLHSSKWWPVDVPQPIQFLGMVFFLFYVQGLWVLLVQAWAPFRGNLFFNYQWLLDIWRKHWKTHETLGAISLEINNKSKINVN